MQVFKAYFKIIRQNLPAQSIYLAVFLFFVYLLSVFYNPGAVTDFTATRVKLVIFQDDPGNALSADLADFLASESDPVTLPDNKQALQDALFFRSVDCIVRIPAGFGQSILDGRYDIDLIKMTVPDSQSSVQIDLMLNRYINTAALYIDSVPGLQTQALISNIRSDLGQQATVNMQSTSDASPLSKTAYYFTYLSYTLMAVMVLGVTSTMLAFNHKDLQRRNFSSPIRLIRYNLQLLLGNLVFAVIVWTLMTGVSLILGGSGGSAESKIMLAINALAFTLACLGISFLVGTLIKSHNVQQSVANVLSLGLCFISGVFVPQELLGPTVRSIASFTPTYWYIHNILTLDPLKISQFSSQILIQLGFAAAALVVALVVAKQKRQTES